MFAAGLLLLAVGICVYLYARNQHSCEQEITQARWRAAGVEARLVYLRGREPDWNFPPKWQPPTAEAWSKKYEEIP